MIDEYLTIPAVNPYNYLYLTNRSTLKRIIILFLFVSTNCVMAQKNILYCMDPHTHEPFRKATGVE